MTCALVVVPVVCLPVEGTVQWNGIYAFIVNLLFLTIILFVMIGIDAFFDPFNGRTFPVGGGLGIEIALPFIDA